MKKLGVMLLVKSCVEMPYHRKQNQVSVMLQVFRVGWGLSIAVRVCDFPPW
jgi:hypothetical protein